MDGVHLLGGGVEFLWVNVFVVYAILLAASDADLHLEPDLHASETLKVLDADGNVLLVRFLGQVEHVGRIERLAKLLEVGLVGLDHTIEPGEKLLGTVIRMEDYGDTVVGSHCANVEGHGDGTRSCRVGVLDRLTSEEGGSSIGDLEDDGAVVLFGSLHDTVGDRGAGRGTKMFGETQYM